MALLQFVALPPCWHFSFLATFHNLLSNHIHTLSLKCSTLFYNYSLVIISKLLTSLFFCLWCLMMLSHTLTLYHSLVQPHFFWALPYPSLKWILAYGFPSAFNNYFIPFLLSPSQFRHSLKLLQSLLVKMFLFVGIPHCRGSLTAGDRKNWVCCCFW